MECFHLIILHIKIELPHHNLILLAHQISSSHAPLLNPTISKNQKNVFNLNLSFTIPFTMTHIITKFNVLNPNLITLTLSNHINVQNNAHQTHTLHMFPLNIIASHNALIISYKIQLNTASTHHNVLQNINFSFRTNHIVQMNVQKIILQLIMHFVLISVTIIQLNLLKSIKNIVFKKNN